MVMGQLTAVGRRDAGVAGCGWDAPLRLSLSEFVDRVGRLPLAFHPGASWRYSYSIGA